MDFVKIKSWQIFLVGPLFQAFVVMAFYLYDTLIRGQSSENSLNTAFSSFDPILSSLRFYIISALLLSLLYFKLSRNIAATLLVLISIYGIVQGSGVISGIFSIIAFIYFFSNELKREKLEGKI